jgi:hypothetical protein
VFRCGGRQSHRVLVVERVRAVPHSDVLLPWTRSSGSAAFRPAMFLALARDGTTFIFSVCDL